MQATRFGSGSWILAAGVGAMLAGTAAGQATTNPDAARKAAAGEVLAPRPGPTRVGWWNDVVFYQIFVRSFRDSGSGPLANDGVGDIAGIIEKLDYLNDGDPATAGDLGIGGLWLMPIHPSPSYHGYDVVDYRGINPQYGTMAEFRRLAEECRKRGIRIIIDWVPNHTSSEHPWFLEASKPGSAKRDWYIWSDVVPDWRGPWNQAVWHRVGDRPRSKPPAAGEKAGAPFYYGIFSPVMPDLNFRNREVTAAMEDVTKFWLEDVGIDGFRIDAIRHLIERGSQQESAPETFEWLKQYRAFYKGVKPEAVTVGEVWADTAQAAAYVGDQLDLTFEFELASAMVSAVREGKAGKLALAQQRVLALFPPNQYGRFLSNHDQTRVFTQLKNDEGAMRAAAVMLLTGPGVPFIYYGEELGMTGDKPDENLRTPMQWTGGPAAGFSGTKPWAGVNAGYESKNVDGLGGDSGSLLNLYRRLIALRNATPALAHGAMIPVASSDERIYSFVRRSEDGQGVLVIVNVAVTPVSDFAVRLDAAALGGAAAGGAPRNMLGEGGIAPIPDGEIGEGGREYRPVRQLEGRGSVVIELPK